MGVVSDEGEAMNVWCGAGDANWIVYYSHALDYWVDDCENLEGEQV